MQDLTTGAAPSGPVATDGPPNPVGDPEPAAMTTGAAESLRMQRQAEAKEAEARLESVRRAHWEAEEEAAKRREAPTSEPFHDDPSEALFDAIRATSRKRHDARERCQHFLKVVGK